MPILLNVKKTLSNDAFHKKIISILTRHIEERCGCPINITEMAEISLFFDLQNDLVIDGFRIEIVNQIEIHILAQNLRGLLYGLGKFLHTSTFLPNEFIPSRWQGISIPDCPLRAVYFATHFNNFYHVAPIEKIQFYVEDLALWGFNALIVWYDMHHFKGIDDPQAIAFQNRLQVILQSAKACALQVGITLLANEGYANSPKDLRADQTFPGTRHIRGGYGVELCPNKPEAMELQLKWFHEEFEMFSKVDLDLLMIWPYDQGGCCCAGCRPWGCNGFLLMIPKIVTLARQFFPNIQIILSTWLFDPNDINEGEWEGLSQKLAYSPDWINYILADSHTTFPNYPLKHGSPCNYPLINFPEISMWNMGPWGGYGANPLPMRFQKHWNEIKDHIFGGVPYSEGIFEDLNKVIWSQFYWCKQRPVDDIVKEYARYEFPGCNVEKFAEAIKILEQNHRAFHLRKVSKAQGPDAGSEKAFQIFNTINLILPNYIQYAWRWRVLFLRAIIDVARFRDSFFPNSLVKKHLEN